MWLGKEPIEGKTMLIYLDEGLGDAVQFARYVPMLAARGARVILVVQDALHRLLSDLPGVSQCLPLSATSTLPAFDLHCPIMSLPLAFGTRLDTVPSRTPYLPPPAVSHVQAWENRLGPRNRLRVGIVWSGNPVHDNDRNRSIPLQTFARLLDLDATFVSLQKDPCAGDQAILLERTDIIDLTSQLTDFADTAALISGLDLVVTVDTSVAHLAGALGRPTWILLPHVPDWRWLLDRDDSPWYPTVRLFRQTETREYDSVLDRVRGELRALIAANDGSHSRPRIPVAAPVQPDALHLLGLLSLQAQQYDQAVEWIARAVRLDPRPEYLLSLGTALQHLGRSEEALKALDKAVQLRPDDAELSKHLGCMLFEQNRPNDALLAFQHVLKLNPHHLEVAEASGFILCQSGRFEEALGYFDLCNGLRPNHAPTLAARAVTLRGLKRNEEALADNRRAHALAPNDAETCNNLGDVLTQFPDRHEEALEWFDRALELRPDFAVALRNKGFVLTQLRRLDEAIATYRHMMALDPNDFNAEWNLSIAYMLTGNFESGWPAREARWKTPPITYPKLAQPIWLGAESIAGKTILIYADEGMGDSIQFARYVPMVAALGARVVLMVEAPTRTLLSGVSGVSECLSKSITSLPAFDVHCPICSLPLAFGTRLNTIPSGTSYLPRPPATRVQTWQDRLAERLGPRNRLRVGLVWSGNPVHKNDHNRSSSLRAFSKLLDAGATFVSLQKDPRADDVAMLQQRRDIIDLTADLTDFVETAALVSCLDLVITVDTSVAHLAAALGLPTWVLLPYVPDWRWMLDRNDSPWYPTMRLFRQSETRDYGEVLDRVHSALLARIATG
jgi:tetratricopeptide (TPR) repeat protein